ncbi:MAG: TetR/AcrR family transcriptional regulator [Anaerolineales bacterium]
MPTETYFNLPEDKRLRIERLAIEEFANYDYHQASISRLVDRAGIAKGSFYQYFEDKEELFRYLLGLAAQEKARFLEEAMAGDPGGTVFDQLRRLMRRGLEFEFSHPGLAQIGYRAYYGDAPLSPQILEQMRQGGRQFFLKLIERGRAEGSIGPSLDPNIVAWLFTVVFNNLGDFLLERLGVDASELGRRGVQAIRRSDYQPLVEEIIGLLERATAVQGENHAH